MAIDYEIERGIRSMSAYKSASERLREEQAAFEHEKQPATEPAEAQAVKPRSKNERK